MAAIAIGVPERASPVAPPAEVPAAAFAVGPSGTVEAAVGEAAASQTVAAESAVPGTTAGDSAAPGRAAGESAVPRTVAGEAPVDGTVPVAEADAVDGNDEEASGDEALHTLLWTAATERPVPEVAALVARLKDSAAVSCPADVALRAAAVSRPLDEVRQLVVLLNEAGYDLHQARTTLRAAAVGRPIEDVVELVNIIGTDSSSWHTLGAPDAEAATAEPGQGAEHPPQQPQPEQPAPAAASTPQRIRRVLQRAKPSSEDPSTAVPARRASSTALRSRLRWPAALGLLTCGLVHLPTGVAGLHSAGTPAVVSAVIAACCLLCGAWLAVQDSVRAWFAAAAVAAVLIGLHTAMGGARTGELLNNSLGSRLDWAETLTVLAAAAVIALAATVLLRRTRTTRTVDRA